MLKQVQHDNNVNMNIKQKLQVKFAAVIVLAVIAGLIAYPQAVSKIPPVFNFFSKLKINLGLDLQGGIHLEYQADLSHVEAGKTDEAMQAVQDVIERRVNAFGVAEPLIYTTKSGSDSRLIVELAGVKDINQAKELIKGTPILEFKEEGPIDESQKIPDEVLTQLNASAKQKAEDILKKASEGEDFAQLAKENSEDLSTKDNGGDLGFVKKDTFVPEFDKVIFGSNLKDEEVHPNLVETQFGWHIIKKIEQKGSGANLEVRAMHILLAKKANQMSQKVNYVSTGLTGKNLKNASVDYNSQGLGTPYVSLEFDDEGAKLFAEITKRNIEKTVAIYLDGQPISTPRVNEEITGGKAQITGDFSLQETKDLVKRLNEGALPVPITLISQQSVEASLGQISLQKSLKAGIIGLILVIIFMLIYYRFLGLIASLALIIYTVLMISIFKLSAFSPWQITLTLPGIAGFVLSIGMAVDANILIFERTKEEIRRGRNILGAIEEGFKRAWTSIRDGNVSSIITSLILIEMGTGFVKGFAVTLIIGVLVSMFTAVVITRTLLKVFVGEWLEDKLYLIGVKNKKS